MIDICLLGTGGMMPLPDRYLTSLLIRYNGKMILIDCGEGTQITMRKTGWGFKSLDAILFTHYHADHIAGLPGLLLTIGNCGRKDSLTLLGPPGLKKVVEGLTVITPELPYNLNIIELSDMKKAETIINNLIIKSLPVDHSIPCLSYCINLKRQGRFNISKAKELNIPVSYWSQLQKGQSITMQNKQIYPQMVLGKDRKGIKICYCTDTRPTSDLVSLVNHSDLFICEGMYSDTNEYDKAAAKKHMLFSEAALLAKQGNVQELWLTHFSPSLTQPEEHLETAKSIFFKTVIGKDLYKKTLKFE